MQMHTAFRAIGIENRELYKEKLDQLSRGEYENALEKQMLELSMQSLAPDHSLTSKTKLYAWRRERPSKELFTWILKTAALPNRALLVYHVDPGQRYVIHKLCEYFAVPATSVPPDHPMVAGLRIRTKKGKELSSPGVWIGDPHLPNGPTFWESKRNFTAGTSQ